MWARGNLELKSRELGRRVWESVGRAAKKDGVGLRKPNRTLP